MRRLVSKPRTILIDLLVIWYGFYQGLHIVVNALSLFALANDRDPFHVLSPTEGWTQQAPHWFSALAIIDLINGLLAILFIIGYFKHTQWHQWLGTVTLAFTVYGMVVIDYVIAASGAWRDNPIAYLLINLTFIPVLLLFGFSCAWGARGLFLGYRDRSRTDTDQSE